MQVNILDAKNRLSQLIRSASAGEDVIIANRGVPVARLVPTGKRADSTSATPSYGLLDWLNTHPLPAHLKRDAKELEDSLRKEREAWD